MIRTAEGRQLSILVDQAVCPSVSRFVCLYVPMSVLVCPYISVYTSASSYDRVRLSLLFLDRLQLKVGRQKSIGVGKDVRIYSVFRQLLSSGFCGAKMYCIKEKAQERRTKRGKLALGTPPNRTVIVRVLQILFFWLAQS